MAFDPSHTAQKLRKAMKGKLQEGGRWVSHPARLSRASVRQRSCLPTPRTTLAPYCQRAGLCKTLGVVRACMGVAHAHARATPPQNVFALLQQLHCSSGVQWMRMRADASTRARAAARNGRVQTLACKPFGWCAGFGTDDGVLVEAFTSLSLGQLQVRRGQGAG